MARRRYITSEMSDDRELNAVGTLSDFSALLYTWAIPHAADDRSLPGEPDDLLFLVCPRRRDKNPGDSEDAIRSWVKAGLCDWVWVGHKRVIYLKEGSFYRIQAYIPDARRFHGLPEGARDVMTDEAETAPNQHAPESAQTSANRQAAAKSPSSLSLSVSSSVSVSESPFASLRDHDSAVVVGEVAAAADHEPTPEPDQEPPATAPHDLGAVAQTLATQAYDTMKAAGHRPSDQRWVGRAIGRIKKLTPEARDQFGAMIDWSLSGDAPTYVSAWVSKCDFGQALDAYGLRLTRGARASPAPEPAGFAALRAYFGEEASVHDRA